MRLYIRKHFLIGKEYLKKIEDLFTLGQSHCIWVYVSRPGDLSEYYSVQSLWSQGQDQNQTSLRNGMPALPDGGLVTQRKKGMRETAHSNLLWPIYWGQSDYTLNSFKYWRHNYVSSFSSQRKGQWPQPCLLSSPRLGPGRMILWSRAIPPGRSWWLMWC